MGKRGHIPLRMCVGCRQRREKKELIRLVKRPEETFSVDEEGKAEGRGWYLCRDEACFKLARKKIKGLDPLASDAPCRLKAMAEEEERA